MESILVKTPTVIITEAGGIVGVVLEICKSAPRAVIDGQSIRPGADPEIALAVFDHAQDIVTGDRPGVVGIMPPMGEAFRLPVEKVQPAAVSGHPQVLMRVLIYTKHVVVPLRL